MRTARAGSAGGTWPESSGRDRDSGWGPGAQRLRRPLAPSCPHTPPLQPGPASTPKGGPLHNPAPRGAFARGPGRPRSRAPGGGGSSQHLAAGGEDQRGGRTYFSSTGLRVEAESAARGEAASVGLASARACGRAALLGPAPLALRAGELHARLRRRASAVRCAM